MDIEEEVDEVSEALRSIMSEVGEKITSEAIMERLTLILEIVTSLQARMARLEAHQTRTIPLTSPTYPDWSYHPNTIVSDYDSAIRINTSSVAQTKTFSEDPHVAMNSFDNKLERLIREAVAYNDDLVA